MALAACSGPREHEPGHALRHSGKDGIFGAYMDGKFDSAGHPLGARVFQAETACSPKTGEPQAEGWGADPALHPAGALCNLTIDEAGPGPMTLNLRLLTPTTKSYPPCGPGDAGASAGDGAAGDQGACPAPPEVLTLRVLDEGGQVLAEKTIRHDQLRQAMAYQNLWVSFSRWNKSKVSVEVDWSGLEPVRIDYLELFLSMRRAVITTPSGVLASGADLGLELVGSPLPVTLELSCDGLSLDGDLAALVQAGAASQTETEFRALTSAPAQTLLKRCATPVHLLARGTFGGYAHVAARTTYLDAPVPCAFAPGKLRVLLTGFEPFPAASSRDNSSEQAVKSFDPTPLGPTVSVMRVTLPVEWDTAARQITDLVDRCQPDVVIGFGQGGSRVEPETIAYNEKDTADISGGVPDNRGIVVDGEPVVGGGPAEHQTSLPAQAIAQALNDAGINATTSTDPGRYICNNLFYAIMHRVQGTATRGGFIHLPSIAKVDAEDLKRLQTIVETAVRLTLQADEALLLEQGFEGGQAVGWALVNQSASTGWSVSDRRAAGGSTRALYYGDPNSGTLAGDSSHRGSATTSPIALPAGKHLRLGFDLYMDTESGASYDTLTVSADGVTLWSKDAAGSPVTQKQWQHVEVDLGSLAGKTVSLAFAFDTMDAIANTGEGVYIDNVVVAAR